MTMAEFYTMIKTTAMVEKDKEQQMKAQQRRIPKVPKSGSRPRRRKR